LGALDNGDGTFSLFVHHEIPSNEGIERDHGSIGSFISEWQVTKFGGEGGLQVLSGQDLIQEVLVWDVDTQSFITNESNAFNRLCSADLPGPGAFWFNGFGTPYRIFTGGEENDAFFGGDYGKAWATFVNGPEKGTSYEIPRLGQLAFENVVASPYPQKKTIVAGLDDSASSDFDTLGEVYFYIGEKMKTGTEFEKAGLDNGELYAVSVWGLPVEDIDHGLGDGKGSTAMFKLVNLGNVADDDGTDLYEKTVANNPLGITKFMRPEDGHWDTQDPASFYFVTTGRFGAPGRVWKLTFDDIKYPENGGTLTLVLDGTEGMLNPDNLTVNWKGDLLIQEDPGGNAIQARIWKSDKATGETYIVAEHNADFFTAEGANFITTNEEASGIIDMKDILGYGWYLVSVQAHADSEDPELVEGGQLAAIYVPDTNMISAPSTASIPMLVPTNNFTKTVALLTTGDVVSYPNNQEGAYRMAGTPDGLGAYDNGDGTFTVLMNHELGASAGIERAHGSIGAFISEWIITKPGHEAGDWMVLSGSDLITDTLTWNTALQKWDNDSVALNRFCSADLAPQSAFYFDGFGTEERIFLGGEESDAAFGDPYGKAWATLATGSLKGYSYELPRLGRMSFENVVASPYPQMKTIVAGLDDSASNSNDTLGEVYFYIGEKNGAAGPPIAKAGLNNGNLYALAVDGLPIEKIRTGLGKGKGAVAPFRLANLGDVSDDDGTGLYDMTVANNSLGVTKFLRPEDGHWNPLNPNEFYFVTTGRFGGPGRLWKVIFTDIQNPEIGGLLELVLDGTEGMVSPDNIVVDYQGNVFIQEDPGGSARLAKIWRYRPGTNKVEIVAEHNPLYFDPSGDLFETQNEESSGIIDLVDIIGPGWYLADVQNHTPSEDLELVEGGQLLAIYSQGMQDIGPSTGDEPMLVPSIAKVSTTNILSVGDDVDGYRMAGIPDGMGALDNKDGTFSLFVHHELTSTSGVERAHGGIGAFISKWTITGPHHEWGPLQVLEGEDLIKTVMIWNPDSESYEAADAYAFNRLCSADLAGPGAFYYNGLGT
ncbi:MAG: hypothetical protein KJT03_11955, partial [Verrucomicrobiae bacterium]|nr:hypothetical protein [Verrucomicrobiae bacterium]